MDWVGELSTVGGAISHKAAGFWFAARDRVDAGITESPLPVWPMNPPPPLTERGWLLTLSRLWNAPLPSSDEVDDPAEFAAMKRLWDPLWGDRRQELAIIGVGLDEVALRARLDTCLLDDAEMAAGPMAWQHYPDPFPRWQRRTADESA